MAVRPIRFFPDPCLSESCQTVEQFDRFLFGLIDDLKATMEASPGVGLAAPQIGVLQRVSVIDVGRARKKVGGTNHGLIVLINPRILESHGAQNPREGCLSVPDLLANVRRSETVLVETRTSEGGQSIIRAEGLEALALQHELDHLDGRLFLDRVANVKTDIFRRKIY